MEVCMSMENQTAKIVSLILLVLGIVLILAGPAFIWFRILPLFLAVLYVLLLLQQLECFSKRNRNNRESYLKEYNLFYFNI